MSFEFFFEFFFFFQKKMSCGGSGDGLGVGLGGWLVCWVGVGRLGVEYRVLSIVGFFVKVLVFLVVLSFEFLVVMKNEKNTN